MRTKPRRALKPEVKLARTAAIARTIVAMRTRPRRALQMKRPAQNGAGFLLLGATREDRSKRPEQTYNGG
jgi:hypothetical protein